MKKISLFSVKGGQGVTTTVALLAAHFARDLGKKVVVVEFSYRGSDLATLFGLYSNKEDYFENMGDGTYYVSASSYENATEIISKYIVEPDVVIFDGIQLSEHNYSYLVTQACYLALRRWNMCKQRTKADGFIFIADNQRALSEKEVGSITDLPKTLEIPFDPAIARGVDSGMITRRPPRKVKFGKIDEIFDTEDA